MVVNCPHCGSQNVARQPGLAENGWKSFKGGLIVLAVYFVLPMSFAIKYTDVVLLIALGLFGIGGIFCLLWIVRQIVSHNPLECSWQCEACKKDFSVKAQSES